MNTDRYNDAKKYFIANWLTSLADYIYTDAHKNDRSFPIC